MSNETTAQQFMKAHKEGKPKATIEYLRKLTDTKLDTSIDLEFFNFEDMSQVIYKVSTGTFLN